MNTSDVDLMTKDTKYSGKRGVFNNEETIFLIELYGEELAKLELSNTPVRHVYLHNNIIEGLKTRGFVRNAKSISDKIKYLRENFLRVCNCIHNRSF